MERGKYKDEEVKKKRTVWEKGVSNEDLRTFLAENKPSRPSGKESQSDDGWIWIVAHKETTAESALQEITKEGKQILDELLTRYTEIEENEKIPKVKTKTSGPSKKMLREAAANDCQTRLRSLGTRYPKGKWLFFERKDFVDRVFEKLAQSIIDGPLSQLKCARCCAVKVTTSNNESVQHSKEPQQLICLTFEDIWRKEDAMEVLECVVKEHGEIPNSAKAELYTLIGLDSQHPAKIRSTLYRPSELFNRDMMLEWQQEQRQELRTMPHDRHKHVQKHNNPHPQPTDPDKYWPMPDEELGDNPLQEPTASRAEQGSYLSEHTRTPIEHTRMVPGTPTSHTSPRSHVVQREQDLPAAKISHNSPTSQKSVTNGYASDSETESDNEPSIQQKEISPLPKRIVQDPVQNASPDQHEPGEETEILHLARKRKRDRFGRSDF